MANRGRPSIYTLAIGDEICRRIAAGESLRKVCASRDDMPEPSTVINWLLDADKSAFFEQYARAREVQAEIMADEINDIADDGARDIANPDGPRNGKNIDYENINRSRLRVDTRKWYLSKVLPKKYGERKVLEHSGADGGPIVVQAVDYSK